MEKKEVKQKSEKDWSDLVWSDLIPIELFFNTKWQDLKWFKTKPTKHKCRNILCKRHKTSICKEDKHYFKDNGSCFCGQTSPRRRSERF